MEKAWFIAVLGETGWVKCVLSSCEVHVLEKQTKGP